MACGYDGNCAGHGTCVSNGNGGRFCVCYSDYTGFNDFYYRSNDCALYIPANQALWAVSLALSGISVLVLIMHSTRNYHRYHQITTAELAAGGGGGGGGGGAGGGAQRKSWIATFPNRPFIVFLIAQSTACVVCALRMTDDQRQIYALSSSSSYVGTILSWIWYQANVIGLTEISIQLMTTFIATARLDPHTRAVAEAMNERVKRLFLGSGTVFGLCVVLAFAAWIAGSATGEAYDSASAAAREDVDSTASAILCRIGLTALFGATFGNSIVIYMVTRLVIDALETHHRKSSLTFGSAVSPTGTGGTARTGTGTGAGTGIATITPANNSTLIVVVPSNGVVSPRNTTSNGSDKTNLTAAVQLEKVIKKLKRLRVAIIAAGVPMPTLMLLTIIWDYLLHRASFVFALLIIMYSLAMIFGSFTFAVDSAPHLAASARVQPLSPRTNPSATGSLASHRQHLHPPPPPAVSRPVSVGPGGGGGAGGGGNPLTASVSHHPTVPNSAVVSIVPSDPTPTAAATIASG